MNGGEGNGTNSGDLAHASLSRTPAEPAPPAAAGPDLAREIDAHLALLQDTYEARGLSPDAARRAARLALGNAGHVQELHRDARSFRLIEDAWQDAAHGFRLLRRSPVFTATAALSLAIGIGANTAIFTVANALLFRPPAGIANPSELVVIGTARGDGGLNPLGYAAYLEVTRRTTSLSAVFAEGLFPRVMGLAASGTTTAEPVLGQSVTSNFFTALGSPPARGRVFADGDESVAILNYDYWRRRFNGDDSVVGRTLRINGRPVTVVGVAAPGFQGTGIQSCDVWLAIGSDGAGSVVAGGRLRPDVPIATAAAEVKTIGDAFDRERGRAIDPARGLNALPFSRAGGNRNIVFGFAGALMVLISLVLAAACANVAGLMLARAAARAREIALRAALGAGRGRLVRQLLTETFVLFLCSGLVGIGLARVLTRLAMLVVPALPTSIVGAADARLARVALRGVAVSHRGRGLRRAAGRSGARAWMRGHRSRTACGHRPDAPASEAPSSSARSRAVSCSSVLSVSFVRVLRYAGAADPGFDPRGVDVAMLDSTVAGQPKSARAAFWRTVIDRVRQMPAVEAASLARVPPGGWEGIGLGGVAPGDQGGSPGDVLVGVEHRRHRLLRDAPHSHRRRPGLRADRHGWGSAGGRGQRDARATDLARRVGDRKALAASVGHRQRRSRRTAARDGHRRGRRHPIEQPDRRPCRTVRLRAVGAE